MSHYFGGSVIGSAQPLAIYAVLDPLSFVVRFDEPPTAEQHLHYLQQLVKLPLGSSLTLALGDWRLVVGPRPGKEHTVHFMLREIFEHDKLPLVAFCNTQKQAGQTQLGLRLMEPVPPATIERLMKGIQGVPGTTDVKSKTNEDLTATITFYVPDDTPSATKTMANVEAALFELGLAAWFPKIPS